MLHDIVLYKLIIDIDIDIDSGSFSDMILLTAWHEGELVLLIPDILFQNKWRKRTQWD